MSGRELPSTWMWAEFGDVAKVASDLVDPQLTRDAPHVAPNHVSSWTGELIERSTIGRDEVTSPKHRFRSGQIVYSKIRPYLAKAILADFDGLCSADMYPIDPDVDSYYLLRWMLSHEFTEMASRSQGRTVLPKINQDALQRIAVPVPPLAEQRRIVKKIEALTIRSRRAREALDALPALIDRYRQSILAAAFRGDLTAEWREEADDIETASAALQRVGLAEIRNGEEIASLPNGWAWCRLGDVLASLRNGLSRRPADEAPGIPILRISAVRSFKVECTQSRFYRPDPDEDTSPFTLKPNDLLFTRYNGSAELVGVAGLYRGEPDQFLYPDKLIRARVSAPDVIYPDFLEAAVNAGFTRNFIRASVKTSAGQHGISGGDLKLAPVPIPPPAEQREIIRLVHRAFKAMDALARRAENAAKVLPILDQSILAKAFRGELVPQDPNDEPASVLLERIRAERAASGDRPRRGRRASTG